MNEPNSGMTARLRIDKWLWAARFFKTRSLAVQAIDAGHVRLNDQRCKPSRDVLVGDQVRITRSNATIDVIVKALSSTRGSAAVAQALYEETAESRKRQERLAEERRQATGQARATGERPTKRDRRRLDRWIEDA